MYQKTHTAVNDSRYARRRRLSSVLMLVAISQSLVTNCFAADEPLTQAQIPSTYDETYYATLDYYGGLQEGCVVKSYRMNGNTSLTDYGSYDEVKNLTDNTKPTIVEDGNVSFSFDENNIPDRFYFSGKTSKPFSALPWTLGISYKLNGVKTDAAKLAGSSGLIEIDIDALPNRGASDYSRNNYAMQAAAVFNDDDILSLEAPGAQIQLIGNLRVVLFMALPGEEQHYVIRTGSNDFAFSGVTFLMVPATLAQLNKITELRDAKKDVEDSYNSIHKSMNTILNTLDSMSGSLDGAADGLSGLNDTRANIAAGKGAVYNNADAAISSLQGLGDAMKPMNDDLANVSHEITDTAAILAQLSSNTANLKTQLDDTRVVVSKTQDDIKKLQDIIGAVETYGSDLKDEETGLSNDFTRLGLEAAQLSSSLNTLSKLTSSLSGLPSMKEYTYNGMTISEIELYVSQANTYHDQYVQYLAAKGIPESALSFTSFLVAGGASTADAQKLSSLYTASKSSSFAAQIEQAKTMNSLVASINNYIGDVNKTIAIVKGPSAEVLSKTAYLSGALGTTGLSGDLGKMLSTIRSIQTVLDDHKGDASEALTHLSELSDIASKSAENASSAIDTINHLGDTLNSYIPKTQQAITNMQALNTAASKNVNDAYTFLKSVNDLLKGNDAEFDQSLNSTLAGLAEALRKSSSAFGATGNMRDATNEIDSVIRKEWDSHSGDADNLLNMDSKASAVSMTSSLNSNPTSIQVLIRTQEIKAEKNETKSGAQTKKMDTGNFFSRIGNMFKDIWHVITHPFSHK